MTYSVRALQARCAALGFWPGPIDGKPGPRTRAAEAAARASQSARGLPFLHPSGLTRVHWHWTAGHHRANATDRAAYHILIEGDGTVVAVADPAKPRSHTLNANSGAIGVSLCAMAGATERPWQSGPSPITPRHVAQLAWVTADLCRAYDIPVSPWSTLSHAEVQPSLGIAQKQKWDITWLPGMTGPSSPISVGDRLREAVRNHLSSQGTKSCLT